LPFKPLYHQLIKKRQFRSTQ